MNEHLDLTILHEISGGDKKLENELFQLFMETAQESLDGMHLHMEPGAEQIWHRHAHILKGSSLNLGAEKLGQLCRLAIDNDHSPAGKKEEVLSSIKAEYAHVKESMEQAMVS